MKRSIRKRFFGWLAMQTVLIFCAIGAVLILFNLHEQHEHPDLKEEEAEEALIVAGVMILMLPVALGCAWCISNKLLRPWQHLVTQAERIGAGHLDERIEIVESHDEIGRLATVLNTAFDRHQHLQRRMQRFNVDASHQLRNPLAAMRTTAEVCLVQERSREEYASVIEDMLEDTRRLSQVVDQLLLLAKAAQGGLKSDLRDVELIEIVQDVFQDAQAIGESKDLVVTLTVGDATPYISAVRSLIAEALTNMVDNALRLTPPGGKVEMSLAVVSDQRVRISVSDTGPGLSPERRVSLFRPVAAEGAGSSSVGLGLAIASDICQAHDGSIGVDDRPGGGCIFWMEFPVSG